MTPPGLFPEDNAAATGLPGIRFGCHVSNPALARTLPAAREPERSIS
ncbi:hypothetical protein ACWEGE_36495 [Amycolatopsis sp. NPDC004747]